MFSRREISLLIVLCCINFCLTVDFMILMPLGPQLMRLLEISPKQFSQLIAVYTLSAGLAGILSSIFLDRIDRKKALLLFLGGFALGNLASSTAPEFEHLLAARAWTGLFVGFTGATMYASLSDSIAVEKRATAMGIVLSTFAIASIFGIPFGLYLAKQFDWHAPFFFVLAATFTTMATAFTRLAPMTEHLGQTRWTLKSSAAQLRFVVGHKSRVTALIFMFFLIMGHFSLIPFLFPSVVANGGINESDLPLVYVAGGLASIISSVLFGRLADVFGKKRVFAVCLLASLPVIMILTRLGPSSHGTIIAVVSMFFVVMGGRMTPAMTLITTTVKAPNRGSFLSLISSLQHLTTAVAAFIAGLIVVKNEDGTLVNYQYVGMLAVACSLIALVFALRVQPLEEPDASS